MIESRAFTKTDLLLLGVLLALVLPLRCWLLYNTEVTARDSIGYIRYALQFERLPWHEVLEKNHQHPGYPVCVHLMSHAVLGEEAPTPDNMRLCAQLVSFLASLVLAVLMYVLGRQFFDATISFGASLLYQYLPISAHHLSDGVSEPVYLVLLVSGLLFMVIALRERAVLPCVLCGVFAGLAYLTRPEGLFIVPAFGLTLMLTQTRAEWRSSCRRDLCRRNRQNYE
jgi:Gpi18-like mannosyltransferase